MGKTRKGWLTVKEKKSYVKKTHKEELRKAVEERSDSYLRELAEPFDCTPQTIYKALAAMNITLKKEIYLFQIL